MSKIDFQKSKAIIKNKEYSTRQAFDAINEPSLNLDFSDKCSLYFKFLWYRILHLGHMKHGMVKVTSESKVNYKKYPGSLRLFRLWNHPYKKFNPGEATELVNLQKTKDVAKTTNDVIDIIIPVYNGRNHLELLLPTLFANTKQSHRFIFVDDCSPDKDTIDFLKSKISGRDDCIFISNEKNLGFTGTVNHGATFVKSRFFVLLNTDVIVPEGWLERLIAPMYLDKKICTTTPFTNGGVFFSYPNFGENHRISNPLNFTKIDDMFKRFGTRISEDLEFVNGVGFCMAIRKECWDKYGGLDEEAFGKGYGEECDICFRYLSKGYINYLVPNLYVYHNHGGSFDPEEKKALSEAHVKILNKRWKGYLQLINNFVQNDPWAKYRLSILEQEYIDNTDCLIIDFNSQDGGACKFRQQIEKDIISQKKKVVTLLYLNAEKTQWTLTFPNNDGRASFKLEDWNQASKWIEALAPKEIKVNNLAFCYDFKKVINFFIGKSFEKDYPNNKEGYIKKHKTNLWYCFHDFYSCCPSFFLQTDDDEFCNFSHCDKCKKGNKNMIYELEDLTEWRNMWGAFLACCTSLRFFSENTYRLASKIHDIQKDKVQIEGHKSLVKFTSKFKAQGKDAPLHIAVIGAWHESKGSKKVIGLAKLLNNVDKNARIYFYGIQHNKGEQDILKKQLPNIIWRGRYEIIDLPNILNRDGVTMVFFSSVVPETFSFVTKECMDIEVPIVCFPLGASGDRVRDYDKGIVTEDFSVESVYKAILELRNKL